MSAPAKSKTARVLRLAAIYLVAGAAALAVTFEVFGGHPDAPFTTYPEYFAIAPVGPVLGFAWLLVGAWGEGLTALGVFAVVFAALWGVSRPRAVQPSKVRPR